MSNVESNSGDFKPADLAALQAQVDAHAAQFGLKPYRLDSIPPGYEPSRFRNWMMTALACNNVGHGVPPYDSDKGTLRGAAQKAMAEHQARRRGEGTYVHPSADDGFAEPGKSKAPKATAAARSEPREAVQPSRPASDTPKSRKAPSERPTARPEPLAQPIRVKTVSRPLDEFERLELAELHPGIAPSRLAARTMNPPPRLAIPDCLCPKCGTVAPWDTVKRRCVGCHAIAERDRMRDTRQTPERSHAARELIRRAGKQARREMINEGIKIEAANGQKANIAIRESIREKAGKPPAGKPPGLAGQGLSGANNPSY